MQLVSNVNPYYRITQAVEDAVVERLTDPQSGLPAIAALIAKEYSVTLPTLDLSPKGGQLLRMEQTDAQYLNASNAVFPAVFVFPMHTEDSRSIKGKSFSGTVTMGVQIFLTVQAEYYPTGLQDLANVYHDALYHVFGVDNNQSLEQAGVQLGGGIRVSRSVPKLDEGEGWFMMIAATLPLSFF